MEIINFLNSVIWDKTKKKLIICYKRLRTTAPGLPPTRPPRPQRPIRNEFTRPPHHPTHTSHHHTPSSDHFHPTNPFHVDHSTFGFNHLGPPPPPDAGHHAGHDNDNRHVTNASMMHLVTSVIMWISDENQTLNKISLNM